jgi:hypothetical protein
MKFLPTGKIKLLEINKLYIWIKKCGNTFCPHWLKRDLRTVTHLTSSVAWKMTDYLWVSDSDHLFSWWQQWKLWRRVTVSIFLSQSCMYDLRKKYLNSSDVNVHHFHVTRCQILGSTRL